MSVIGIVHRIDATSHVRTETIEASSAQPALDVFRSIYGPAFTEIDLAGSAVPWGEWVHGHPLTILGTAMFSTGAGPSRLAVLAGPDSGFTLDVDPHTVALSRLPGPGRVCIADPSLSRTPGSLDLDASRPGPFTRLGSTILAPASPAFGSTSVPGSPAVASGTVVLPTASVPSAPTARTGPTTHRSRSFDSRSPFRSATAHIAPDEVDRPRPARPPQWWTFLIPIVIGVLLAVTTKMWWFLLFSVSAPLSGYVAFVLERRRFARDTRAYDHASLAARASALEAVESALALRAAALRSDTGLCLGFGAALESITIDESLYAFVDHHDGRVVIVDVPLRVDPHTTVVTVTGTPGPLRAMALAWLADERWAWSPCESVRRWPELIGTRIPPTPEHAPTPRIGLDLDLDSATPTLILRPPDPVSSLSLSLSEIARATTVRSDLGTGPVPGRVFTATLMPPGRFVTTVARSGSTAVRSDLPDHGLGDLVAGDPDSIRHRWQQGARGPVAIGRNADGTVALDLFHDGPHALVAGTTGSGKSLLLQSWLLSLAEHHPPSELTFVLIDFKGGATFAPLQGLAHTDCVLDDFDSAQAFRALVAIRAEITRREWLLAESGCADVLDLTLPPPRLVVVIDEFHALMATHPHAADLLEHLTALGRSLGMHLILATQRPLGVVTAHMKANISIRICLRVRDAMDSLDVIGTDAAAELPKEVPGAACLDDGSRLTRFRVALPLSTPQPAEAVLRPRVRPWVPASGPHGSVASTVPTPALRPTGLDLDALTTMSRAPGIERGRPVVLPSLPGPDTIAETLCSAAPRGVRCHGEKPDAVPASGLVDLPEAGRQFPWTYRPDRDGSIIVVGQEAVVTAATLVRLAEAAATTHRIVALGRIASTLQWAEIGCDGEEAWRIRSVLNHLDHGVAVPTLLVCGNWSEFLDSLDHHDAAAWDSLLRHSGQLGLGLALSGVRGSLSSARIITTRLVFPPPPGEDGLAVGLSRARFTGTWPDYRAVLIGPGAEPAPWSKPGSGGRSSKRMEGADIQLVPPSPETTPPPGWAPRSPRWFGLGANAPAPSSPRPNAVAEGRVRPVVEIGVDPFGRILAWDPIIDGAVLTIRCSQIADASEFARSILASAVEAGTTDVVIHTDAHLDGGPPADPTDGRAHILTLPLRFTVPYGSPLSRVAGPLLVIGPHTNQDLSMLGCPRIPAFDAPANAGWFITETGGTAVRAAAAGTVAPAVRPADLPAAIRRSPEFSTNRQEAR